MLFPPLLKCQFWLCIDHEMPDVAVENHVLRDQLRNQSQVYVWLLFPDSLDDLFAMLPEVGCKGLQVGFGDLVLTPSWSA